jgi:ribosome-associated heat shock protein Hsp15
MEGMSEEARAMDRVRIDLWLWAVRLYKTRGLAAAACRGGKVRVLGASAKPSRPVRVDDVIEVSRGGLTRTVKVLALLKRRIGAKVVPDYLEDLTAPEVYEEAAARRAAIQAAPRRHDGGGRPTKRDRRQWSRAADKAAEREEAIRELMRKSLESSE